MNTVIENYILEQPKDAQLILMKIREMILKEFPNTEEKFSYGMPLFYLNGKVMWIGNMKNHIGIYPEPDTIIEFQDKLVGYKCTKGAIQFQKNQDIPYNLIMEIVRYRICQNMQ